MAHRTALLLALVAAGARAITENNFVDGQCATADGEDHFPHKSEAGEAIFYDTTNYCFRDGFYMPATAKASTPREKPRRVHRHLRDRVSPCVSCRTCKSLPQLSPRVFYSREETE